MERAKKGVYITEKENIKIMNVANQKFIEFFDKYSLNYIHIKVKNKNIEEISSEIWEKVNQRLIDE